LSLQNGSDEYSASTPARGAGRVPHGGLALYRHKSISEVLGNC